MKPIRFTTLAIVVILLAACAGSSPEPVNAPSVEFTSTPRPIASSTEEPTETPIPETTSIVVTDSAGNEFTLEQPAERIVSLAPSNTEILFALGAGAQVVARDTFSDFPAEATAITDIGGGFGELDMETVLALDPDLILAADISPPEQIAALEELGLPVFLLGNPVTLDGLMSNLRTVGLLTGRQDAAETLVADLERRVEAVLAATSDIEDVPLVFYELDSTDPSAPWTSGEGTFVDTIITMAGGENLGRVLEDAWAQISIEELIEQDPDVIVLGDAVWGGITVEAVAARSGWENLTAVREDRVYPFDDNLVSRPGPRMVDGLEEIARLLHPDRFE